MGHSQAHLHLNIWATVRPRKKGYYHFVPKENQRTTGATLTDSSANSFIRSVEWGNEKGERNGKKIKEKVRRMKRQFYPYQKRVNAGPTDFAPNRRQSESKQTITSLGRSLLLSLAPQLSLLLLPPSVPPSLFSASFPLINPPLTSRNSLPLCPDNLRRRHEEETASTTLFCFSVALYLSFIFLILLCDIFFLLYLSVSNVALLFRTDLGICITPQLLIRVLFLQRNRKGIGLLGLLAACFSLTYPSSPNLTMGGVWYPV